MLNLWVVYFIENNLLVHYKKKLWLFDKPFSIWVNARRDGLCFINCLILYHEYCLNKILTIDNLKMVYYNYLLTHRLVTFNSDDYPSELIFMFILLKGKIVLILKIY